MTRTTWLRLLAASAGWLGVALPLSAQHTLYLDNGDRLTGDLLRIESATWVFRFEGSDVNVPVGEVSTLAAPSPIGVRLWDGTIAAVTVEPADDAMLLRMNDGSVQLVAPAAFAAVGSATELDSLRPVRIGLFTPFTRFWRASGSLGFSDKSGNSRAQGISTSLELARRGPRDRLRFQAGFNREQSMNAGGELEPTVSKIFAALRTDVFFTDRFFAFAETRQERDRFQDLDRRSTYGGGLGRQLLSASASDLSFAVSGGLRTENFTAGGSAHAAVVKPGLVFRQVAGPVTVDWDLAVDSNVEDLSDYALRSQASLTMTVLWGIGFRIGVLNEFDNTPRPGVEEHDMLITTTLAYSIGR